MSRYKTTFISNFVSSPAFRTAYIGVPLIAGGLIAKHGDHHFYDLHKDYLPAFRNHADDYLQYLPAVVLLGMNIPLNDYTTGMGETYEVSTGSTAGIEGAWFFSSYIGVGGRFTISNLTVTDKGENGTNGTNTLDATSICGGSYLSFPISSRFLAGGKILCGYIHYPELQLSDISIRKKDGFCFGNGISMTFRATEYYGLKLFLDYNLQPSPGESNQLMNTLAVGSSFAITF